MTAAVSFPVLQVTKFVSY